ncbi:MAG: hypothetical protein ACO398_11285 [Kiritimatiellia bacterium]
MKMVSILYFKNSARNFFMGWGTIESSHVELFAWLTRKTSLPEYLNGLAAAFVSIFTRIRESAFQNFPGITGQYKQKKPRQTPGLF